MARNPYKNITNPYQDQIDWDLLNEYWSTGRNGLNISNKRTQIEANLELYNKYTAFQDQMIAASADYEANSYSNIVAQMLENGLNPDLLGANQGTQSTSVDTPAYDTAGLAAANNQAVGNAISGFQAVLGAGSQAFQTYLQWKQIKASTAVAERTEYGLSLDNMSKEQDFMMDYILQNVDADMLDRWINGQGSVDNSPEFQNMLATFQSVINPNELSSATGMPLDMAERLYKNYSGRINSPEGRSRLFSQLAEYSKKRLQYHEDISNPGWSDTFIPNDAMQARSKITYDVYQFSQKFTADYYRALNAELQADAANQENVFKSDYYGTLSGTSKASAENSENVFTDEYYKKSDPSMKASSENSKYDFESDANEIKKYLVKVATSCLKSSDSYCQMQGQQILQYLSSGSWMNDKQFLATFFNRGTEFISSFGGLVPELSGSPFTMFPMTE